MNLDKVSGRRKRIFRNTGNGNGGILFNRNYRSLGADPSVNESGMNSVVPMSKSAPRARSASAGNGFYIASKIFLEVKTFNVRVFDPMYAIVVLERCDNSIRAQGRHCVIARNHDGQARPDVQHLPHTLRVCVEKLQIQATW